MVTLLRIAILFCSLLCCPVTRANSPCPLFGPDVPPPVLSSSSHAFGLIKRNLTSAIQKVLVGFAASGHNANTTSFSVDVWSAHDEIPLFTFHYSAPALTNPAEGVATVDSTKIYRIGSISKLLTVYTFLVQVGDSSFNLPITKYVPELAENGAHWETTKEVDDVDWSSITVGALASQMAGIFRDFAPGPTSDAELAKYGLPPVPSINVSYCGDVVPTPCDRADFFTSFLGQRPVVAPFWTPIYSNAAFQILAYALENITGQAFASLLASQILKPLNMTSTFASTPASSNKSIIPINASTSWYSLDTRGSAPAGGFYSSIDDLRTLGVSIIRSTLLSTAQSRR
jgi:CubicO group peptidase (beta-lactamase class C family)